MSETVHYKGKLIKLKGEGTIEDIFLQNVDDKMVEKYKKYIDRNKLQEETIYTRITDFTLSELYQEYYITETEIYKIEKVRLDNEFDVFNINKVGDDYEFELMYYNGGLSMDEALDNAMLKFSKRL